MNQKATVNGAIAGMFRDFLTEQNIQNVELFRYMQSWQPDDRVQLTELGFILHSISQLHPRDALGLKIAQHFQPSYSGVLGYLILHSRDFEQAILQFKKYYALMWDGFVVDIIENDQTLKIQWNVPQLEDYADNSILMNTIRIGYELGISCFMQMLWQLNPDEKTLKPQYIELPGAMPKNIFIYESFFNCPLYFQCKVGAIIFEKNNLKQPINLSHDYFIALYHRQAEAQLKYMHHLHITPENTILNKVQKALALGIDQGSPTLDFVAKEMAISKSKLLNLLREQKLNFKTILASMRLELAKTYIQDEQLSLSDIASLLSFSEQSALNHFFKRHTGMTPNQYRKSKHN
ncbi:AraC family transcriptional regulator [Acinetobacter defluvii]|uniref:AraC family transcriptional regulator n=1 Tax=Acinetobacter defluvii TaxID=1871111 RepID=A0A2S2FBQ3_9GAMM|nr:AraC family transcriptional regulator [Acinetobacter defluvii]AWL28330.1 AraC family transcriptional regulator [Acinetobacter defluvii]